LAASGGASPQSENAIAKVVLGLIQISCYNDASAKLFLREMRSMLSSMWAVVQDGKIQLSESVNLPEGARVLITLLPDDEGAFWQQASENSLGTVWDNTEDDVYAQLLDR